MLTAADLSERARPFAAALIEREERRTGSRMAAYENVASMVGVSSSWLRKLIARQPFAIAAHHFHNLAAAYVALCERVEREAAHERQRAAALRKKADEVCEGTIGMANGHDRSETG